jgi:predicted phosphoribosyltransferase
MAMLCPGRARAQRELGSGERATACHHRSVFADRADAGRKLGAALAGRVSPPAYVLGMARGGVVVAAGVAAALGAPLDVVLVRKLGAPRNPELAIGAIAPGVQVLDREMVRRLGVDAGYLDATVAAAEAELIRRTRAYRGDRPEPDLAGVTAVVVDDGVATGATAMAALRWARARRPVRVVFAVPVGPADTVARLRRECDEVVVLQAPASFAAVGLWYADFAQVGDEEVEAILAEHAA